MSHRAQILEGCLRGLRSYLKNPEFIIPNPKSVTIIFREGEDQDFEWIYNVSVRLTTLRRIKDDKQR
jgi:hypothetical protein